MSVPWGRGASEHRPGLFTKSYLQQFSEASCAVVFSALCENLRNINQMRVEIGEKTIRCCTYNSFARYWHWFKLLGLIEPTGETEPAIYKFLKKRRLYRLTAKGLADQITWFDPVRTVHPEFG